MTTEGSNNIVYLITPKEVVDKSCYGRSMKISNCAIYLWKFGNWQVNDKFSKGSNTYFKNGSITITKYFVSQHYLMLIIFHMNVIHVLDVNSRVYISYNVKFISYYTKKNQTLSTWYVFYNDYHYVLV